MLEIEQKYPIEDPVRIEAALLELGARFHGEEDHRDFYLNAPDRDFRSTDEVLRVRTVEGRSTLTYKGPKQAGEFKARREIEVDLVPGPDGHGTEAGERMIEILRALRYRPTAEVLKVRHVWRLPLDGAELTVCIDRLVDRSHFLELEVVVADEGAAGRARTAICHVERLLGLKRREERSYLRMLLEGQGGAGP